uniref:F-box domain-containing protein n=1 Tax=Sipha flava TaxID=143950 RepID=A0A2S2PWS7_9HEMI
MADNTYRKSFCVGNYESFFTTSTSCKTKNDSFYNNTLIYHSTSNNLSSGETISFDQSLDLGVLQLFSTTNSLTFDYTTGKLNDTTTSEDSIVLTSLPCTFQESQKKSKKISDLHSHLQMQISRINTSLKNNAHQHLKSKNSNLQKMVYHKRINLEGQKKVDFMYYLAKRHHFFPVTEKIFSFLYGKDIVKISSVSKVWYNVVKYSPLAKKKKESYLKYMESVKENIGYFKILHSSRSNRRILADIGNIVQPPSKVNGEPIY